MTVDNPDEMPDHWTLIEKVAFRDGFDKGMTAERERNLAEARASAAPPPLPRSAVRVIASVLATETAKRTGSNQLIEHHIATATDIVQALFDHRFAVPDEHHQGRE